MKVHIEGGLKDLSAPYKAVAQGALEKEVGRLEAIANELVAYWVARKDRYERFREKGFIGLRARALSNSRSLAIEWTRGRLYQDRGERKLKMSVIRRGGDTKYRMSDFGNPGAGCRVWEHAYIAQMEPVFAEMRELINMEREAEKLCRKICSKHEKLLDKLEAIDLPEAE